MDTEISEQIHDYIEAAAPAIPLAELTERRAASRQLYIRASLRSPAAPRRFAAATVAAVVVAAGAVAIGVTEAGGSPARSVAHHTSAATLTAAMVHRLQKSSKAALASAGHAFVTYSISEMPDISRHVSGSIDITFSGHDFNSVARLPKAPTGGASHQELTIRVVNGQIYTFGAPGRPLLWYHFPYKTGSRRAVPDPRTLLQALQPEAAFEARGAQLIGGIRTTHLRATRIRNLPASLMSSLAFVSSMGSQPLAVLDVWADSHDVVRQMRMTFSGRSPQGRLVEIQTVRFLDIGKPERITPPAHYVSLVTHR